MRESILNVKNISTVIKEVEQIESLKQKLELFHSAIDKFNNTNFEAKISISLHEKKEPLPDELLDDDPIAGFIKKLSKNIEKTEEDNFNVTEILDEGLYLKVLHVLAEDYKSKIQYSLTKLKKLGVNYDS